MMQVSRNASLSSRFLIGNVFARNCFFILKKGGFVREKMRAGVKEWRRELRDGERRGEREGGRKVIN